MEFKIKLKFTGQKHEILGKYFTAHGQIHKAVELRSPGTLICKVKNAWNTRLTTNRYNPVGLIQLLNDKNNIHYQWVTDISKVPENLLKYKVKTT